MAFIRTVEESEAAAELAEVYSTIRRQSGGVANVMKAESLAPKAMDAHYRLYRTLMHGDSPLTPAQRELIAVAVSQANACRYCCTHHAAGYRRHVGDGCLSSAVAHDVQTAPLDAADRALVDFARALTRSPEASTSARPAALRAAGFDDAAILSATEITAYFNFVNRLVLGLGVELEGARS